MAYAGVEEPQIGVGPLVGRAGPGLWRMVSKWAVGLAFVSALGVLLLAVDATELSAAGPSHAILRRTVASLTEIDALLVSTPPATVAGNGNAPASPLVDFPIALDLNNQGQALSTADLRNAVLDESADKLYAHGFSVFHATDSDGTTHVQLLSPPGAVRYTAGLLTKGDHDTMRVFLAVVAVVAAILAVALMLLSRGFGRLTSLGVGVVAASLPLLLLATVLRFFLRLAAVHESDYLNAQFYALGRDVAWLPIRNALAFLCLGVVLAAAGAFFSFLSKSREASPI